MSRRRKGASDSHFYYKWLDKALCDLQCARLLLTYGGDHYNIAFHCQQAIERRSRDICYSAPAGIMMVTT